MDNNIWLPGADPMPPGQRQGLALRAQRLQQALVNIAENMEHRLPDEIDRFYLARYPGEPWEYMMRWHHVDRIVRLCHVRIDETHWLYVYSVINHFLRTVRIQCVLVEMETDALDRDTYKVFTASGNIYNMARVLVTGIWDDPDSRIVMALGFPYELLASARQRILETLELRVVHPAPGPSIQLGLPFPSAAGTAQ